MLGQAHTIPLRRSDAVVSIAIGRPWVFRRRAIVRRAQGLLSPQPAKGTRGASERYPEAHRGLSSAAPHALPAAQGAATSAGQRARAMQSPPPHADDLALAQGALAGATAERELLFERLRCVPRFVAAVHRRLGAPLDRGALEDLAQDVLLSVWRKLPVYRGDAALESWAFTFCTFETLNAVRRSQRRRASQPLDVSVAAEPAVLVPVDRDLIEAEALALLDALSRREAEVVQLRHFEGLDVAAIAERLALSTSSVKTHYYRALDKLRVRLSASGRNHP